MIHGSNGSILFSVVNANIKSHHISRCICVADDAFPETIGLTPSGKVTIYLTLTSAVLLIGPQITRFPILFP